MFIKTKRKTIPPYNEYSDTKVWVSPHQPTPWLNVLQFCSDTVYLGIAPTMQEKGSVPKISLTSDTNH